MVCPALFAKSAIIPEAHHPAHSTGPRSFSSMSASEYIGRSQLRKGSIWSISGLLPRLVSIWICAPTLPLKSAVHPHEARHAGS
jgi:hypothetical protein